MGRIGRARLGLFYVIDTCSSYRNLSSKSRPRARCSLELFGVHPPRGRLEGGVSPRKQAPSDRLYPIVPIVA